METGHLFHASFKPIIYSYESPYNFERWISEPSPNHFISKKMDAETDDQKFDPLFDDSLDDKADLSLDKMDNKIWLVKVPRFLSEKWKGQHQDGQELGRVRIYETSETKATLILPEYGNQDNFPKEYNLKFITSEEATNSNGESKSLVFTHDLQDKNPEIVGTIVNEAVITPVYNSDYKNIMRNRLVESNKPQRSLQVLDETIKSRSYLAPVSITARDTFRKKVKTNLDTRKERVPKHELIDLLFAGFEKYPYWNFKGIQEYTNQPATYLKEVLQEICILNKRGPYTSMYQLKPEFRQQMEQKKGEGGSSSLS